MVDVNKCFFVGEVFNWPDRNANYMQQIKPPRDYLVFGFFKTVIFALIVSQLEYCKFLESDILETGNNWFLHQVQSSIREVVTISNTFERASLTFTIRAPV